MEIQYLKLMKNNPEIDSITNEGITEQQIVEIEAFAGRKFPNAYREFLFLGGENNNVTQFLDASDYSIYKNLRRSVERILHEDGFKIEKDFWVIAALDGGQQFDFFFYDEGENPPIYYYSSFMGFEDDPKGEGKPNFKKIDKSFSAYVDSRIKGLKS